MIDAFALAAGRPWLIQQESLETILAIAQRQGDSAAVQTILRDRQPQALQAKPGERLEFTRTAWARDGVAVVPITGPVFRYANFFSDISGATSTQHIARDFNSALENPHVKAIVLDINSPGGEATGINELAKMIHAARGRKRVVAYGGGTMASAAYWLGSAAAEIVIDETAALGSIGVVMSYTDTDERDAKAGVRRVEIVSSQSPDKRVNPGTDEGRAKVQAVVDDLAAVFVDAVAAHRKVKVETVLSDFGRGGVLIGQAAVKAGMADRIGSLEAVIAELAGSASTPKRNTTMSDQKGQVTVSSTDDLRTALAAGYAHDQIHIAAAAPSAAAASASQDALDKARAEGVEEGRKAVTDEAVKAERTRIRELQALSRDGFAAELQAAIDNGDSPATFALALVTAANKRGITLDAIRKDAPKAQAHATAPNADNNQPSWDGVVAKFGGK